MTNKFDVVELDSNTSLLPVHEEHRRVDGQFELWTCADEGTANRLPATFVPRKLQRYQSRGRLHLFSLFRQQIHTIHF